MGMKKSIALMSMMALAMGVEGMGITERGSVGSGKKPEPPKPKEPILFKNQEGVLNTIKDYNLIVEGKSKKGAVKQSRVKSRVEKWLNDGWLKQEDLKINQK